jgi:OmpA-OmpF porin, OOP family
MMLRELAFVGMFLPATAVAQPIQGLYISGDLGANFVGMLESSQKNTRIYTNTGPVGLAALGWGFGNGLRVEVEGSDRSNGISGIFTLRDNGLFRPLSNVNGSVRTYAVMANAAYDIPLRPFGLQPYFGAGVGYGWLSLNNARGDGDATLALPDDYFFGSTPVAVTFGTAGAFAYQAIAGVSLPLPGVAGLSVTLEYRYFGMARANETVTRTAITTQLVNGAIPSEQRSNGFTVGDNAVLIGLRYSFGVAPPPVPVAAPAATPAPMAVPAHSYLVFFDWDKATLTDRARLIVAEAASNSTRVQYTRIEVNGYTDTSGTPQYNQGLSVRRAQAVAAELVKDGVPRAAISIQGFGESRLLVPTGPGVREPQNRRVEIIIR